jgi:hypothetical protein
MKGVFSSSLAVGLCFKSKFHFDYFRFRPEFHFIHYIFWIFIETSFDKLLKLLGVIARQLRRIVLWDEEEDAHGMQIGIGWLPFGKFDSRDAQRPYVRLETSTHRKMSLAKKLKLEKRVGRQNVALLLSRRLIA